MKKRKYNVTRRQSSNNLSQEDTGFVNTLSKTVTLLDEVTSTISTIKLNLDSLNIGLRKELDRLNEINSNFTKLNF